VRHRFGEWELDEDARQLRGSTGTVHVEPQVYEVLAYLIANRDRAVAKTELLQEIWGHDFVSESALTSRIKSARAAIGDNGRDQRHVRTVHGFGYQFVSPVSSDSAPPAPSAPRAEPGRPMPTFLNPFRGREDDCAEVGRLLVAHRLVTVLGPGGIGKTRLAVEALGRVDRQVEPFDLPARFVDLASTRDEGSIPDVIAVALGIEIGQRGDPTDAVCEYLATIPHLLVLDNCEHVLAAAASVTTDLLGRTTATRVLATSRIPLGIPGERLHRLGPLPVPAEDVRATPDSVTTSPAAAVFLDRAHLAGADLLVDPDDAELLAGLCRALDGLPLALELAAGRLSAFSLTDLVGLLDRRLDLIGDRSNAREHRHRTLRATVEWSYDLLEVAEQRLFRFLSVFPAGVTLDGIQWISARLGLGVSGLDAAGQLVDASLVTANPARSGTRYAQLETLRTFGLDQLDALGERDEAGALLAGFVLDLVARVDAGVRTSDEVAFVERFREELPNVRAAWAVLRRGGRTDDLLHVLRHLAHWARCRDANEIWAWSDDLLARVPIDDARHADVRAIHAQAAWRRGDIEGATADGLTGLGSTAPWAVGLASAELATAYMFSGDLEAAERTWVRHAELDEPEFGLACAAIVAAYSGRIEEARRYLDQGDARARGSISFEAWRDYARGEVSNAAGVADTDSLERAIDAARSVDASFIVGVAMVTLTSIHAATGDIGRAAGGYAELIEHWLRSGSWTQQWTTLRHVAAVLEDSHPELALAILRSAAADPLSPSLHADSVPIVDALVERLLARLGPDVDAHELPPRLAVAERATAALRELGAAGQA
jgi:predicted ATPase/DNA-binding winged helix-turn-helix (wHTH) protein